MVVKRNLCMSSLLLFIGKFRIFCCGELKRRIYEVDSRFLSFIVVMIKLSLWVYLFSLLWNVFLGIGNFIICFSYIVWRFVGLMVIGGFIVLL